MRVRPRVSLECGGVTLEFCEEFSRWALEAVQRVCYTPAVRLQLASISTKTDRSGLTKCLESDTERLHSENLYGCLGSTPVVPARRHSAEIGHEIWN